MRIEHIDDIFPYVQDRPDFAIKRADDYIAIDYLFTDVDTFDHPARLECRGIKFAPDGKILARPLAKFFNIGEKEHTQPHVLDFAQPHLVTEKLDGSMIHPAIINGEVVLMTRMGWTDVARKAENVHMGNALEGACRWALMAGITPIFEWTAPENRIVIRYERPVLTLLALRNTITGDYEPWDMVQQFAQIANVPVVNDLPSAWRSGGEFLEFARAVSDREGFVVKFSNGLWVKAKSDDYVVKHRSKDAISREKNALRIILEDKTDDLTALLDEEDTANLLEFKRDVLHGINETAKLIEEYVKPSMSLDRKEFATLHLAGVDPMIKSLCFAVRDGKPAFHAVRDLILKNLGSGPRVDSVRKLFNARMTDAV